MVDVRTEYPIQSLISNKVSREKGDNCCLNCSLLKVKLQKMSSELKSAHEMIKVFQEEINSTLWPSQLSQSSQHNQRWYIHRLRTTVQSGRVPNQAVIQECVITGIQTVKGSR